MATLSPILPGLAAQFLVGWAMLVLFMPSQGKVHALRAPLAAGVMLALGVLIELFLSPYLFQGSLVAQWALFVMLGSWICAIPLGKAMLAQFCVFGLMLGQGLIAERFPTGEVAAEEQAVLEGRPEERDDGEDPSPASLPSRIQEALLPQRLMAVRDDARHAVYGSPEPPPEPADIASVPTPVPDDLLPLPGGTTMTGAEFEALVYATGAPPAEVAPRDPVVPEDPPQPLESFPVIGPDEFEVIGASTSITSDQRGEITEVKNRSTDRSYAAPTFEIGAVSIGRNGRFAMVDGQLLREGAIIRTGGMQPRGWKLYQVTPAELFWQPLE